MPEIFSGTTLAVVQGVVARWPGRERLYLPYDFVQIRTVGQYGAFNVFCPLPPPAHPSSRYYRRQAALHDRVVWLLLRAGCFPAGVHYRRRDER
ncbi:hypothetical protein MJK71_26495 [Escherichia coli]|nr:hypothetical protein MJK71_26495 [Escherichia coli]